MFIYHIVQIFFLINLSLLKKNYVGTYKNQTR